MWHLLVSSIIQKQTPMGRGISVDEVNVRLYKMSNRSTKVFTNTHLHLLDLDVCPSPHCNELTKRISKVSQQTPIIMVLTIAATITGGKVW